MGHTMPGLLIMSSYFILTTALWWNIATWQTNTQNYLLHALLYLVILFTECFPHFSAKHFTFLSSRLWVDALVPFADEEMENSTW